MKLRVTVFLQQLRVRLLKARTSKTGEEYTEKTESLSLYLKDVTTLKLNVRKLKKASHISTGIAIGPSYALLRPDSRMQNRALTLTASWPQRYLPKESGGATAIEIDGTSRS